MTAIHLATRDDLPRLTETLARAFHDDPVVTHLQGGRYHHRRARMGFEMLGRNMLEHGRVLRTDDFEAAALWARPGHWRMPVWSIVRTLHLSLGAYRTGTFRALAWLSRVEKVHPAEPHYYLEVLGTDPSHQGRGWGSRLVQPMLDVADDERVGAYLESSKPSNVPYYRRFGFEVVREITHPTAPPVWTMWRDPR